MAVERIQPITNEDTVKFVYYDYNNDMTKINDDMDLASALRLAKGATPQVLKICIIP